MKTVLELIAILIKRDLTSNQEKIQQKSSDMHALKYVAATKKEFALYSHIGAGVDRGTGNEESALV